jgi:hypothetical protein
MTETPEPQTAPTPVATAPPARGHDGRPSRLAVAALWVAIVAGVVFIVAIIFFSGFALGRHSGGGFHHGWGHDREFGMYHHAPMMWPGGPAGPGMGPGFGPGGPGGPGGPTTLPSPPTTPRP